MKPVTTIRKLSGVTQRGVALITALVFLLVLTMVGLSLANSTMSEEKVSRNARDLDIAFAAAEAALRDAELQITGAWQWPYKPVDPLDFTLSCTNGLCDATSAQQQTFQPVDALDFYGSGTGAASIVIGAVTGSPQISGVRSAWQPRYMIEMVCTTFGSLTGGSCNKAFRITAQGRGRLPNSRVVLQEVYRPLDIKK
ncbi:pilus assembly PilX family protein [Noviherbaspirillum pedocola]|uniref:Type 4 fimbrial biogenesis protein PilX N-terminal domain-containing protein n=1 Tax=Noviherbaspirillum pedocola TaxID=2801341 RepID=A0A934T2D1_9BURK|nr:PilX N-terminal domain-containing pilus assembly protein [Noviherbaspirillum pedocola]MBK4738077.1 hypothetical protein [Noviherbaspirillum pedocola]